jgi:hypothetical protein
LNILIGASLLDDKNQVLNYILFCEKLLSLIVAQSNQFFESFSKIIEIEKNKKLSKKITSELRPT